VSLEWVKEPGRHCKDMDYEQSFGGKEAQKRFAHEVCFGFGKKTCPVMFECRDEGRRQPYGVWGGLPEGSPGRPRIHRWTRTDMEETA
jgi:hypothetical protein